MHAVQLYRLVVLPVANTWMSWTLLRKLAWAPGSRTVALLAVLVLLFTAAGLQVGLKPGVKRFRAQNVSETSWLLHHLLAVLVLLFTAAGLQVGLRLGLGQRSNRG